jgi:hypothetical protein
LVAAVRCFPALRELTVDQELATTVPKRKWLRLMVDGQLAHLRTLVWTGGTYTDRWLAAVCAKLPRLTHLEIALTRSTTKETLALLIGAERLAVLGVHISWLSNVSDTAVSALLQRSRALRRLSVVATTVLTDAAFAHASACTALQTVKLSEVSGVTAQTLQHLSGAPGLTELELCRCAWLSDAALAHLERCRTLTKLDISDSNRSSVTDVGFAPLSRLPALRVLRMIGCSQRGITDAAFAALAESDTLQELDMSFCRQETITDRALVHLSRCAALTALNLYECTKSSWGAAGARALASSSLRALNVANTRLCEHVALLGESTLLSDLVTGLHWSQSYKEWARDNGALLHAPRLTSVILHGVQFSEQVSAVNAASAMVALQAMWAARPAVVQERRAAAVANSALSIKLHNVQQCCVLR